MELGQRIKDARLEAGMSQRQLCGQMCTRNMLSLIESGKAKPSMETLRYFAGQLGRPISWFLDEEITASPNQQILEKAEKCLKNGDFSGGLECLGDYRGPDSTFDNLRYFLEIVFLLELAHRAVDQGKMPYAKGLLDRAARAGENTIYPWDRQRWILLRAATGENAKKMAAELIGTEQRLMIMARAAMEEDAPERAITYLKAVDQRSPEWQLLLGQALLKKEAYAEAAEHLREAEGQYPQQCLPALEICYREMGNFEMAYRYACRLREQK